METSVRPIDHNQSDKGATQTGGNNGDLLDDVRSRLQVDRGPDARGDYIAWCPFHPDGKGKPPHQPNLHFSERGYKCFACSAGGSLRDLAKALGILVPDAKPEAVYDYKDERGTLLYQVVRYPGKRFLCRRPDGAGGWTWSLDGTRRIPYRLPELMTNPQARVFAVEGEKDADALAKLGLTATTNPGGAGKWRDEYSKALAGRDVVILPDNDDPGRRHADQVAANLNGVAKSVKIVDLPGLATKGDVSDWLRAGGTVVELDRLAEASPEFVDSKEGGGEVVEKGSDQKQSQADRIVALALDSGVTLFHDSVQEGYAKVPVNGHHEIVGCRSRHLKLWLSARLYKSEGRAPRSEALNSAIGTIEAKSVFDGEAHELHNRVAACDDAIWYDLTDAQWRAVKITANGWELVSNPPILFRRYAHQQPQISPAPEGSDLKELLRFINIRDQSHGLLLLVYVVSCLVPDIPHPVLVLHGPEGSAKTTALKMVRKLIDPSATEVLTLPDDKREIVQQLSHHWAPYFDNVSKLTGATSDALCRATTGDGFSKRRLWTDDDDVICWFRRCCGLSDINIAARQPDLLDRCIVLGLRPIAEADKKTEKDLWAELEEARPRLVSAMFTVLSRAMTIYPSVKPRRLLRMADFCVWGCAIAEALGFGQDAFLSAIRENAAVRHEQVLEDSPVAKAVLALMEAKDEFERSASELLEELEPVAIELHIDTKGKGWPGSPSSLSRVLHTLETSLAAEGIGIYEGKKDRKGRKIRLARCGKATEVRDGVDGIAAVPSQMPSTVTQSGDGSSTDVDGVDGIFPISQPEEKEGMPSDVERVPQESAENAVNAVYAVTPALSDCSSGSRGSGVRDGNVDAIEVGPEMPPPSDGQVGLPNRGLPEKRSRWPREWLDAFEERAAIVEFDGGMSREDAEEWAETILRGIFAKAAATEQGGGRDVD